MAATSQMRAKFAESAYALFSERGFGQVNLDEIAARAGVTKGSLYWHFKSRQELILASCDHFYRTWDALLQAEIAATADPEQRLQRVVLCCVDNCVLNGPMRNFALSVFVAALHDEEIRAGWIRFDNMVRELFIGLVEDVRGTGKIPTADPARAVDLMLAMMDGIERRAAFTPEMCVPENRQLICENLMQILNHT